ncbi:MAG: hypothetical protein QG628_853 [Patescibacteria group bacterium]|jgi:hypothetical protein|nr:hypothetical protein [Patescibacteria group bacterium]
MNEGQANQIIQLLKEINHSIQVMSDKSNR